MEYIPDIGDVIILTIDPALGHEQQGRRPCLVLSNRKLNKLGKQISICPITTRRKGYPIEVNLPAPMSVKGVVLSTQVMSFDWRERNLKFIEKLEKKVVKEVLQKLAIALNMDLYFPRIRTDFE